MPLTDEDRQRARRALFPEGTKDLGNVSYALVERAAQMLDDQRAELQMTDADALKKLALAMLNGKLHFFYDSDNDCWSMWTDRA